MPAAVLGVLERLVQFRLCLTDEFHGVYPMAAEVMRRLGKVAPGISERALCGVDFGMAFSSKGRR